MATTTAPPSIFLPTLSTHPETFLQPTLPLYADSLAYLQTVLDPLAQDISTVQQERQRESRSKKRKRGQDADEELDAEVLRVKGIHTKGFGVEQVWAQVQRVVDAAVREVRKDVEKLEVQDVESEEDEDEQDEQDEELGVEGVDYEVEGVDDGDEIYDEDEDEDEDLDMNGEDDFDEDELIDDDDDAASDAGDNAAELVKDKFGLNDGFFSIDDFNRQSEFLEQQDARGENDGAASDEEDVDWDADPMQGQSTAPEEVEADDEDDNEDGPTFGDPDAPSEDEEELEGGDIDGMDGLVSDKPLMYADFFAPPAQKKKKNKKGRPNPHNFPATTNAEESADDNDMKRTMEAVHRDLFEDDGSDIDSAAEEEADAALPKLDPSDPRSRRSTHERRKAALAEEIRKLEAANVAKRQWTLSGEARAADRPLNSLLEEDLDFERTGKPVPVITAEVTESIEALIKRRILAHDFQDIPRRRPDDLATGNSSKRGRLAFELDDSKPTKSLADEYAEEHLRRTDPAYTSATDAKLAAEQAAITVLWRDISAKLDALSSWHFRPKAAAPAIEVRVDAPVISMEDARPSGGGDVGGASQLAPQEVYKAGEAASGEKSEVVAGTTGLSMAREEMDRDEKRRRRRREKERSRKASGNENGVGKDGTPAKKEGKAARERKQVVADLKKGGVKVIGKKGVVEDVEGREVRKTGGGQGAAALKL